MPKLLAMGLLYGFVELGEQLKAFGRNPGEHHPPVGGFAAAGDQAALFHTVEEPGYIWVACDHAVTDLTAGKTRRRATQNAEHIVLS